MGAFDPILISALPGLVAVVAWALTNPGRFATVAVLAAMILPVALIQPGGTQVALADVLLLVTGFAWLVLYAIGRAPAPWLAGNRMAFPLFIFVGWNAVSLAWSDSPRSTIVFTIQLIEIVILVPLVFATLPRSIRDIRVGLVVFIACANILSLYTIYKYGGDIGNGNAQDSALTNGLNKNVIGSFVGAGLTMAYTLALNERDRFTRDWLIIAAALNLAGLIVTVSRGSLLGALVALPTASLLLGRKRLVTCSGVALIMVAYLGIVGAGSTADRTNSGSYDSAEVRHYSFAHAVDKIEARPFLGSGAATYEDEIKELGVTGLFDPNNWFLLTWAELGVGGVLILLFLLASFVRLLLALRHLPPAHATPGIAGGCIALSFFIHFQTDVTWTRGTTTLAFAMIGLMLASTRLTELEGAKEPGPRDVHKHLTPERPRTPTPAQVA